MEDSDQVTFDEVEMVRRTHRMVMCRIGMRVVGVPPRRMLPGTTIYGTLGRGRLVPPREMALNLGLI